MTYDFLIVGAGYSGCVLAERIATQLNKKVLIVEQRNHIGGNAFDYFNESGILVHKYGPHIFHTNMKNVWDYLSQYTSWFPYYHHVLGVVEGQNIPVPFNLNSIYKVFPQKYAEKLENLLTEKFGFGIKIPILKLMEENHPDLKFLAEYIYKNIFLGYTVKQWGFKPEELDFSVSSRVPVYISRDDRYFQDNYQGIPANGYSRMFEKMIKHPNIQVLLQTNYKDILDSVKFDKMIFSGQIDYFFDHIHGELPYRSLDFKFDTIQTEQFQEVAQVNYPNNHDYTRITEFKHFSVLKNSATTVAYEYPQDFVPGKNDPYYPVPNKENDELYKKYQAEVQKLNDSVYFVGRLAEYKYYNMDQIVGLALQVFKKKIAG
jgi:UDP-galactopyranose mutase